jgi:hypothetical protein
MVRGVNSCPDLLTNQDTGRFRRPEPVRPVSVPSRFRQVSGSGVASQANEAGTLPLKPARSPTTFACMLICIRAWPAFIGVSLQQACPTRSMAGQGVAPSLTHLGQVREEVSFSVANAILDKTSGACSQRHCDPHWLHTHISDIGTLCPTFP